MIEVVAVQFLPAYKQLVEEALAEARDIHIDKTPFLTLSPELSCQTSLFLELSEFFARERRCDWPN